MQDVKGVLQSKAVWGSLLAIVAVGLHMAGIQLGDTDGFANDLVAMIGAGIAIFGRIKAVKKIG